jgi:hypothetical protein
VPIDNHIPCFNGPNLFVGPLRNPLDGLIDLRLSATVKPQNTNEDRDAAITVAAGVEAALQVLGIGCWDPSTYNSDVLPGSRYFANVQNPGEYAKGWSSSLSIHDTGVKESPTIFTHTIKVVDKNGSIAPLATTLANAAGSFNFVVKYYPGQGMAVTSNTFSVPHFASTPGYVIGVDANVNVRWAQMFMEEVRQCKQK